MKNIKILLIGMLIALGMLLMSCSDDGPTSPSISDFSGTWKGGIQHPAYDGGSLEIVMVEKEAIDGRLFYASNRIYCKQWQNPGAKFWREYD